MKHDQKLDLVWFDVHPDGDGLKGLYLNDSLLAGGDEYHDDIAAHLNGVLLGLYTMGWDGKYKTFTLAGVHGEEYVEEGNGMHDNLHDFDLDVTAYEESRFKP